MREAFFAGVYVVLMFYSLLCGPDLFFRLFPKADADKPETAISYLVFCLIGGFTLISALARLLQLARTSAQPSENQE